MQASISCHPFFEIKILVIYRTPIFVQAENLHVPVKLQEKCFSFLEAASAGHSDFSLYHHHKFHNISYF